MGLRSTPQEEQVQALLTDEILEAYFEAVVKFESNDLVVASTDEAISVYPRGPLVERLRQNPETPTLLLEKLGESASDAIAYTRGHASSFWFITDLESSDTTVCCAVSAMRAEEGSVS